jgi:hypothetical protein
MLHNILIAFGIGFGISVAIVIVPVILSYYITPSFPSAYKYHIENGDIER